MVLSVSRSFSSRPNRAGVRTADEKSEFDCFDFAEIPFAEDIREFPFPSLSTIPITDNQLHAAENVVQSLSLLGEKEGWVYLSGKQEGSCRHFS